MSGEEKLRSRLEQAEANLTAARRAFEESVEALKRSQDDNEALRIELEEAKSREEATATRLHEAEDERAQLSGEVRQLRIKVSIEKKQKEKLQLRLIAQKKKSWRLSLLRKGRNSRQNTRSRWTRCISLATAAA